MQWSPIILLVLTDYPFVLYFPEPHILLFRRPLPKEWVGTIYQILDTITIDMYCLWTIQHVLCTLHIFWYSIETLYLQFFIKIKKKNSLHQLFGGMIEANRQPRRVGTERRPVASSSATEKDGNHMKMEYLLETLHWLNIICLSLLMLPVKIGWFTYWSDRPSVLFLFLSKLACS